VPSHSSTPTFGQCTRTGGHGPRPGGGPATLRPHAVARGTLDASGRHGPLCQSWTATLTRLWLPGPVLLEDAEVAGRHRRDRPVSIVCYAYPGPFWLAGVGVGSGAITLVGVAGDGPAVFGGTEWLPGTRLLDPPNFLQHLFQGFPV
jgi:hypothetical protein